MAAFEEDFPSAIATTGVSQASLNGKEAAARVFNQFLGLAPQYRTRFSTPADADWHKLPGYTMANEDIYGEVRPSTAKRETPRPASKRAPFFLCARRFFSHALLPPPPPIPQPVQFAGWMVQVQGGDGKHRFKYSTIENYLSKILNMAALRCGKPPGCNAEHYAFFQNVLYPPSEAGRNLHWFSRLKFNVCRECCALADAAGEDMKKQEVPLGLTQMRGVNEALSRQGSPEACLRKSVMHTTFNAGGRAGEAAGLGFDIGRWCPGLRAFVSECVCMPARALQLIAPLTRTFLPHPPIQVEAA